MVGEVSRDSIIIETGNTGGTEATKKGDMTNPPKPEDVSPLKSGLEFFKETMSGLKGKSFSEKIEFIGERIALRKEQKAEHKELKAEFKEKMADYNLSLEKKAYVESLDRREAEAMKGSTPPKGSKDSTVTDFLFINPNKAQERGKDLGASISFMLDSMLTTKDQKTGLTEVAQIIKDNTTGENEGKVFTKKDAFEVIAKNLAFGCSPKQLFFSNPSAMRVIAKTWAEDGRQEKADLLNAIATQFEKAKDPKNVEVNYKQNALDHAKTSGDSSFLRLAGGQDGLVQKYLSIGGKSEMLARNMSNSWSEIKASDDYKTLQEDVSKLLKTGVKANQTNLNKMSEEGVKALGTLTTTFVAKAIENGIPDELKSVLTELQNAIRSGDKDVGAKISNLFVNAILKNLTPLIFDDQGLHPDSKIEDKKEAQSLASSIAILLQATVTSAFNGTGRVSDPVQIKFKNDVLIPLKANIDEFYKAAGMYPEGLEAKAK